MYVIFAECSKCSLPYRLLRAYICLKIEIDNKTIKQSFTLRSLVYFSWLTPITNMGASAEGAEMTTFEAPPDSMCTCDVMERNQIYNWIHSTTGVFFNQLNTL